MKKILALIIIISGFCISSRVAAQINEDNVYYNGIFKVQIQGPKDWQVTHKEGLYLRRDPGTGPMINGVYFQVNYFSDSVRGAKGSPHFIVFKALKEDCYKAPELSTAQLVEGVMSELKNIANLKIVEKPTMVKQKGREWVRFIFEIGTKRQENYYRIDHEEGVLYIYSAGAFRRTIRSHLDSTFESIEIQNEKA